MNKRYILIISFLILAVTFIVSCEKLLPALPANDELLDGPVDGLSTEEQKQFLNGDIAFNDEIFTPEKGLGPRFVSTSCGSCHAGDGKGTPFTTLIRFTAAADSTGNTILPQGPTQLQNRAIPGYTPELLPMALPFSKFTPPANTGLGFLNLVSDADLLAMTDSNDVNNDGISGTVNWNNIPSFVTLRKGTVSNNGKYICRFGKKASVYDLLQQAATAYNQDMGITSTFEPIDVYSGLVIDPEVSTQTVNNVVFYLKTLKAPVQRTPNNPEVVAGKNVFIQLGCESCHKQTLKTAFSTIEALNNKDFHPFTDLLLHDMGSGLDDGFTEGGAKNSEWRTAPLWGLGLAPNSQGGQYFLLHDGRAKSIEEAITIHGGEATASKNKFTQLTSSDRDKLIKFIKSL